MRITIPDLVPNTAYVAQVRAVGQGRLSEWSRAFYFTTDYDTRRPDTPANVTWVVDKDNFVAEWDAVTTAEDGSATKVDRYELELVVTTPNVTKYLPITASSAGLGRIRYILTFDENKTLFGFARPTVAVRVRAINSSGVSSLWTSQISATNPPPAPPTSTVATATVNGVSLTWTAPVDDDLVGYNVYTGSTAGFTPNSGNRIYSGSATRTTYGTTTYSLQYFKVFSVDKFGQESSTSADASATPLSPFGSDTTAPSVPTGLAATAFNNPSGNSAYANVSWSAVTGDSTLSGYVVRYRRDATSDNYIEVSVSEDTTAIRVELPYASTAYDFAVRAYDYSGNYSNWSSEVTATAPTNTAPSNVTGLVSTAGKDSIQYNWNAVSDTDLKEYELTFSTSSTFASGNTTFKTGTANSLSVGGLSPNTTYYARVRAIDTGGLTSASWSSTDTETTGTFPSTSLSDGVVPATPSSPNTLPGLSYIYATWAPVITNASGGSQPDTVTYDVHLGTTSGFSVSPSTKVTEVSGTSVVVDHLPGTNTPLSYGQNYYLKLVARDRDGSSGTSAAGGPAQISKVASTDVTSIGADLIVPGTGIIANLIINTGGGIQSSNYSSNAAGWRISPTGAEFNDANTSIKADAIKAGTLGGVSGSGVINIATGTSLVFNGGYLKSNTYTGTAQASNPSGAGFYLGNDGLRIDSGIVSASALTAGTISGTNTITLSGANAKIVGGTWELSGTGLTIPNGAITASKLALQIGQNLVPPQYADFEFVPNYYNLATTNSTTSVQTTNKKISSQALQWTASATSAVVYLGATTTDYNIQLTTTGNATDYIISYYAMVPTGSTAPTVTPTLKYATATSPGNLNGTAQSIPANSTWARYSTVVTLPASTPIGTALLYFTSSVATTIYLDGIQVEEKISTSTTPSAWTPPSSTSIDGGIIRTGSIQSTALGLVWNAEYTPVYDTDGVTIIDYQGAYVAGTNPAWRINTQGAADFSNLNVTGSIVVGSLSDPNTSQSVMASANFIQGEAGWQMLGNGDVEFRQIAADSINGEAIQADTLSVNKLSGGTLSKVIELGEGSSIVASGLMGESVAFGSDGFKVTGPHEIGITNVALNGTTGVATITTAGTHGYAVGSHIYVGETENDVFQGEWDISAATSNTLSFVVSGTPATVPSTATTVGTVMGIDVNNSRQRPVNINFPSNGASPNIISGQTKTTELFVSKSATLGPITNLPARSTMYIASGVESPSTSPNISFEIPTVKITGDIQYTTGITLPIINIRGVTKHSNGNYLAVSYLAASTYTKWAVSEHDATTGALVAQRYSFTTVPEITVVGTAFYNNKYYYGTVNVVSGFTSYDVTTLDASTSTYTSVGTSNLLGRTETPNVDGFIGGIGFNTTNNRLVFGWQSENLTDKGIRIREYNFNANGTPNTTTLAVTDFLTHVNVYSLAYIGRGNVGLNAADKYFLKQGTLNEVPSGRYRTATFPTGGWKPTIYLVNTSTAAVDEKFVDGRAGTRGGYYDSTARNICEVEYNSDEQAWKILKYQGYDTIVSGTTNSEKWVGVTYANATLQTTIGGAVKVNQAHRKRMVVSGVVVPYDKNNPSTTPDRAYVYVANQASQPTTTLSQWVKRAQIPYSEGAAAIVPNVNVSTGPTLNNTNDFQGLGGVGQIITTSGKSFWKGDDQAQFYNLQLASAQDVDQTYGNTPGLRIGKVTNPNDTATPTSSDYQMRLDGNEISTVLINNATQTATPTTLLLNVNGNTVSAGGTGTHRIGANGRAMGQVQFGSTVISTSASGQDTISHGGTTVPTTVLVSVRGTNSNTVMASSYTTSNFTVTVSNTSGAIGAGNSRTIDWVAIWT